jgi:hypothetical protein
VVKRFSINKKEMESSLTGDFVLYSDYLKLQKVAVTGSALIEGYARLGGSNGETQAENEIWIIEESQGSNKWYNLHLVFDTNREAVRCVNATIRRNRSLGDPDTCYRTVRYVRSEVEDIKTTGPMQII